MIAIVQSAVSSASLKASRYGTTGSTYNKKNTDGSNITREQLVYDTVYDKISILPFYDPVTNPVRIELYKNGSTKLFKQYTTRPSAVTEKLGDGGNEIIEYKIIYSWNVLSPIMYPFLTTKDRASGIYEISASTIIKNENFK